MLKSFRRSLTVVPLLGLVTTATLVIQSCSSAATQNLVGSAGSGSEIVRVSVVPRSARLLVGDSLAVVAYGHLRNSDSTAVAATWSATGGSISEAGWFHANGGGTATIRGTSIAQPALSDSSAVEIATIQLTSEDSVVSAGGSVQVSSRAVLPDGSVMTTPVVTWSTTGGTISPAGVFSAPDDPGTYEVSAQVTEHAASASLQMRVTPATLQVLILNPTSVSLMAGATRQFSLAALWSNGSTVVPAVAWSATGGTVSPTGLYTAGQTAGSFQVIAAATANGRADTSDVIISVPAPTLMQLVLSPKSVTLTPSGTNQYAVSGTWSDGSSTAPAVTWSATGGTITSTGAYTAGSVPGPYRVIATQTGGTKADTATVTISVPVATLIALVLNPKALTLVPGATQQFGVAGAWSDGSAVVPAVTYAATGGVVTAAGLYAAGATPGVFHLIAVQQGGTRSDTSTVTIAVPPPTLTKLTISPRTDTLASGAAKQFSVTGTWSDGSATAPAVTYAATGGTITTNGLYTAGTTAGAYHVIAMQQGGTRADTALVTIPATLTTLVLNPTSLTLVTGATQQFSVAAAWSDGSTAVPPLTWTATGGTVTTVGLYAAGSTAGTYRVIATQTVGGKADTSSVVVSLPAPTLTKLTITPKPVALPTGGTQQFVVAGNWSDGSTTTPTATFSAAGGTISGTGLYTAGAIPGVYAIVARQATGALADTAIVTLTGPAQALPGFAHPFSAQSPWNSPIAAYQSASYQPVVSLGGFLPAVSSWPGALWVSMYQATQSDPVVNIYYNRNAWINVANGRWKRSGNSAAVEAEIRQGMDQAWDGYQANMYSTTSLDGSNLILPSMFHSREGEYWSLQPRVPAGAVPPPDADGHMTVFQPNGWALEMLSPIRMANGDIVTMFASYTDPTGTGTGTANGRRASMVPNYAGLLRNGELASGHIDHALSIGLGPEALARVVQWPATAMDRTNTNYSGTIPMGALLSIPPAVDLTTLGLQTSQGHALAQAAQSYGMYVTDQTGSRYLLITTETGAADIPAWNGALDHDLKLIMAQLKLTSLGPHK